MSKPNSQISCWQYIKSDLRRYTESESLAGILRQYMFNRSFKYSFWLRLAKHSSALLRLIARLMHRRLSGRYLIQIPVTTQIGFGLYLGHHMCVVVNETAIIGNNATVGAGSVVPRDVPENATVAGVPARVLHFDSPGRYVNHRWQPTTC